MTSQPHYVRDYHRHVGNLLRLHPIDEAMSLAVGGSYESVGKIEADILCQIGLGSETSLVDLGCGSGRLSTALTHRFGSSINYLGIDVVQSLLDYAALRAEPTYNFVRNVDLRFPIADESADFISAFSVFTHLHPHETFAYLADAKRVLRPNGAIVFSYLTLPAHWRMLPGYLKARICGNVPHLTCYLQPWTIRRWARELDMVSTRHPAAFSHHIAVFRRA